MTRASHGIVWALSFLSPAIYADDRPAPAVRVPASQPAGFVGVWFEQASHGKELGTPSRGGLATFPPEQGPIAIYSEKVGKTFFCYGGATPAKAVSASQPTRIRSQVCASFFDHKTGQLARPVVVAECEAADACASAACAIDAKGQIWIFVPLPGKAITLVFRSARPFDINHFDEIVKVPLAHPQPWFVDGKGFLLIGTRQPGAVQEVCFANSADGESWSEPQVLAAIGGGCSDISWARHGKTGVAIAYYGSDGGPATGVCYVETQDLGKTWTTAQRMPVTLPLKSEKGPALVLDYAANGQGAWLEDLNFDTPGNPTILYLVSRGGAAGTGGPYLWTTARWLARGWRISGQVESDHPCDGGCLYVENRSDWRLIAPTLGGPEPGGPGGEVLMWVSDDFGRAWARTDLTRNSDLNHNYIRRPLDAHADFYALWADGAIRRPSASHLYFTSRDGKVYRMPETMTGDVAKPEPISQPPGASKPAN